MAEGGGDKTEKPTGKRLDEARKKGQVAKSQDINQAVVLMASLFVLSSQGPKMANNLKAAMQSSLELISNPAVVSKNGLGGLLTQNMHVMLQCVAPIAFTCLAAGVLANVAQVRPRPAMERIKPSFKKINPAAGAKRLFGPQSAVESLKQLVKLTAVGVIAAMSLLPKLDELGALVGMPPGQFFATVGSIVLGLAQRAGAAYLIIAALDYAYQKWKTGKDLKMSKQEVKEEHKSAETSPEVRGAIRRRQMEEARKRMMDDIPQADVVVTNPTHFAVALAYDGESPAPKVLAKGQDLIAMQIKKIAKEHDVPVIEDKPLARGLFAAVEVGHMIPEEFFQAVAQLLAFVYRVAGRKVV
jgi:flagellar biosynthetic protein FlhB